MVCQYLQSDDCVEVDYYLVCLLALPNNICINTMFLEWNLRNLNYLSASENILILHQIFIDHYLANLMIYIYNFSTHCTIYRLPLPCAWNQNAALLFHLPVSPLQITLSFLFIPALIIKLVSWRMDERRTVMHITANTLGIASLIWDGSIRALYSGGLCPVTCLTSGIHCWGLPAQYCLKQVVWPWREDRHT